MDTADPDDADRLEESLRDGDPRERGRHPGPRMEVLDLGAVRPVEPGRPDEPEELVVQGRQVSWRLVAPIALVVAILAGLALWPRNDQQAAQPPSGASASPTRSRTPSGDGTPTPSAAPSASPTSRVIEVGHPLLPGAVAWEFFGVDSTNGDLLRVQPATGRITRTPIGVTTWTSDNSATVFAGSHRALVIASNAESFVVPDGRPASESTAGRDAQGAVLPGPAPEQLWVFTEQGRRARLTTLDGTPAGSTLEVPSSPGLFNEMSPDGAGGMLINGVGGAYILDARGIRHISPGLAVAVGRPGWLVVECDDRLVCGQVLIDRDSGLRRTVRLPENPTLGWPGTLSPDGTAAVLMTYQDAPSYSLIDLVTGTRRPLVRVSGNFDVPGSVWSPDGRWILLPRVDGKSVVIDACTGTPHDLGVELPTLAAIAVRDLAPSGGRPKPACPSSRN